MAVRAGLLPYIDFHVWTYEVPRGEVAVLEFENGLGKSYFSIFCVIWKHTGFKFLSMDVTMVTGVTTLCKTKDCRETEKCFNDRLESEGNLESFVSSHNFCHFFFLTSFYSCVKSFLFSYMQKHEVISYML